MLDFQYPSSTISPARLPSPVSPIIPSPRASHERQPRTAGFEAIPRDGSEARQEEPRRHRARFDSVLYRTPWLAELSSYLVAVLALLAVIILLKVYEGRPLPQWPSLISINSLISIFTSILKAAMLLPIAEGLGELKWIWFGSMNAVCDMDLFDSASRGPLLHHARSHYYGSCLAVDPFTQQILQYANCLRTLQHAAPATISRTNNYTAAGIQGGVDYVSLDFPMHATLYQGLLTPPSNATSSIAFDCPTGNCTFSVAGGFPNTYKSLGMCSSVGDVSHLVSGNGSHFNYTLPSGLSTLNLRLFMSGMVFVDTAVLDMVSESERAVYDPLLRFQAVMIRCAPGHVNMTTGKCSQIEPWAFEASLYPCIRTYSGSTVSHSILIEPLYGESIRLPSMNVIAGQYFSIAGDYPALPDIDCTPSTHPTETTTIRTTKLPGRNISYYNPVAISTDQNISWYPKECVYNFDISSVQALISALPDLLSGNLSAYDHSMNDHSISSHLIFDVDEGPAWLQRLYANGTVNLRSTEAYLEGLANAITATMRQKGDPSNSRPVEGVVLANQTCVRVQWAWIALPAAPLASTAVFFVGMVLQSRRSRDVAAGQRGVWKSSSMPLLWCGLDEGIRKRYDAMSDLQDMKDVGAEVMVRLEVDSKQGENGGGDERFVLR